MNVAFDPWIPVVNLLGERVMVSLVAVLTEGALYADLAVRPHERVALMRLFTCVAHAALDGPKDYDECEEVPKRLPDAARRYLEKWKDSFELFHEEKPWLQVAGLQKNKDVKEIIDTDDWTPVSKLNFSFATGNNTTLFDHEGMSDTRSISIAETLLAMITFQCFSPGGLISQVYWNGTQTNKSSKDGPCCPCSMIHAFIRGADILHTIHLNLPSYSRIYELYGMDGVGSPVWEKVPRHLLDESLAQNATRTYLGRLVPITRFIKLAKSGQRMLLGDGLVYPTFVDGFPQEPTATVYVRMNGKKEERALLPFRPAKCYWRELAAIGVKRNAVGTGGPLSLDALPESQGCDIVIAALARDQATIVDTKESVYSIPAKLRTELGLRLYESEVHESEQIARRLGWAIETYRQEIDGGWEGRLKGAGPSKGELKNKLHAQGTTFYWTQVENSLSLLFEVIDALGTDAKDTKLSIWRKSLFATACDAYRIACGQTTPRQVKAFAKGWQKLVVVKTDNSEISPTEEEDK